MATVRLPLLFTPSALAPRSLGAGARALQAPEWAGGAAVAVPPARRKRPRCAGREGADWGVSLWVPLLLLLLAVVAAPEDPKDQEAICQRHRGVVACRVW
jgi:hypothetical protein